MMNERLAHLVRDIKIIKRQRSELRIEHNNHLFRSLVSQQRGIGGNIRYETYPNPDEDIAIAETCHSVEEWRARFMENLQCNFRNTPAHQDFVRGVVDDKTFHTPDCDCSYYAHKIGGDSVFWVFEYERKLEEVETQLKQKQDEYALVLREVKQVTPARCS